MQSDGQKWLCSRTDKDYSKNLKNITQLRRSCDVVAGLQRPERGSIRGIERAEVPLRELYHFDCGLPSSQEKLVKVTYLELQGWHNTRSVMPQAWLEVVLYNG